MVDKAPFQRLSDAYMRGVETARTDIFRHVYERFHGGLVPPGRILSPSEKLQKWQPVQQQDPYYTEFFKERSEFLRKFTKDDREAALMAWQDTLKIDDDLERTAARESRRKSDLRMVPIGSITQAQGRNHRGYDVAYPGQFPLYAPTDGLTIFSGEDPVSGVHAVIGTRRPDLWGEYYTGIGFKPIIGKGYVTLGHLNSVNVERGQPIQAGQIIGTIGSTGNSTAEHLHIEAGQGKPFSRQALLQPGKPQIPDVFSNQAPNITNESMVSPNNGVF